MKTIGRVRTLGAPLLLIVVLLTFICAGTAQASTPDSHSKSWQVVSSPNTSATYNWLSGVAAFSANDVWAVGGAEYYPSPTDPLVEHWNGTAWSIVSTPSGGTGNGFNAVTTIPGTHDLWAVGTNGLAELWNGTRWKIIPTATVNSPVLYGVVALSATDAWTVGNYYQGSQMPNAALIEHWNGTAWSQVSAAYPSGSQHTFLNGVTAFSANNVWAVGSYDNGIGSPGYTLVEHWTGKKWHLVSAPNPGSNNNVLGSVTPIPKTHTLWAVGYTYDGANTQTFIEYWNGTAWSVSSAPAPGTSSGLSGVVALSAKSAWVVGSYTDGQGDDATLTEQWNGTTWNVVASPNPTTISTLGGLARVPGSGTLWAVGSYYNSQSDELTLTERYS